MPRINDTLFQAETQKLEQDVLLHLLTVDIPAVGSNPATTLYLVDSNADVEFNSQLYSAFPFQFSGGITHTSDGSVDKASLSCANPERILMPYITDYAGLRGTSVLVYTIYEKYLVSRPSSYIADYYIVDGYTATDTVLTLSLDPSINLDRKLPRAAFQNNSCRFRYKDPLTCKYNQELPATCNKTLQDCKNHTITFFDTGTLNKGVDHNSNTAFWGPAFPANIRSGYLLEVGGATYTIVSANTTASVGGVSIPNAIIIVGNPTIEGGDSGIPYKILKGNERNFGGFPGVPMNTRTLIL